MTLRRLLPPKQHIRSGDNKILQQLLDFNNLDANKLANVHRYFNKRNRLIDIELEIIREKVKQPASNIREPATSLRPAYIDNQSQDLGKRTTDENLDHYQWLE